jgi:hypothetical protein
MTPATKTIDSVVVKIRARTEMESMIESAVYRLQPRARELKKGMLVNRITCDVFIVSLTDNAAYGTIYERTSWCPARNSTGSLGL